MEPLEAETIEGFFRAAAEATLPHPLPTTSAFVVTHLLRDRPHFLKALAARFSIASVIPKPKSQNPEAVADLERSYPIDGVTREHLARPESAVRFVTSRLDGDKTPFVLLDIGGYFAPALSALSDHFGPRLRGVVEDTENGLQKYVALEEISRPVYSAARSPLKNAEDHLVGQSIVFSTEALLRSRGSIMQGRLAVVIGYGKLGRSIANLLRSNGVQVRVHDRDAVRLTEAHSHGFPIAQTLKDALRDAGLVMCATGRLSLRRSDFRSLANGAYIASVTSSDDELELSDLRGTYRTHEVARNVTRYATTGHYFHVLNRGNAVNFLHGAVVGPAIYLVQAELITCAARLADERTQLPTSILELEADARTEIAKAWIDAFGEVAI